MILFNICSRVFAEEDCAKNKFLMGILIAFDNVGGKYELRGTGVVWIKNYVVELKTIFNDKIYHFNILFQHKLEILTRIFFTLN